LHGQGNTVPTTGPTTTTGNGGPLPRTGSGSSGPVMFGLACVAAGTLLAIRRRRSVVKVR
jgi:LPXTG-motif cell wall-anchored protein